MKEAMPHEEFENYLTLLSRMLQLRSGQTEAIAEELSLHLEERLGELTDRGVDPKKAVTIALGEFGDATALANKFTEISQMKRRRVMMRSMVGGFCIAVAILAMAMTVWPEGRMNLMGVAQAEPTAKASGYKPLEMSQADLDNQETREKLNKKIDPDFIERPLNEFLIIFGEQVGVQCRLDKRALEYLGITSDIPVTLQFKSMPAEMVLRLVCKDLELSYFLDNGFVIVTTQDELENLSVRMYDVKSLVGECSDQDLIEMIKDVVDPEGWVEVGGSGTLSTYRGILVIRQTESAHEELGKVLDQLRDKL